MLHAVKIDVDEHRGEKGRYVITGSQAFPLMRGVSESLAGRAAVLSLQSMSLAEAKGRAAPDTPWREALEGDRTSGKGGSAGRPGRTRRAASPRRLSRARPRRAGRPGPVAQQLRPDLSRARCPLPAGRRRPGGLPACPLRAGRPLRGADQLLRPGPRPRRDLQDGEGLGLGPGGERAGPDPAALPRESRQEAGEAAEGVLPGHGDPRLSPRTHRCPARCCRGWPRAP